MEFKKTFVYQVLSESIKKILNSFLVCLKGMFSLLMLVLMIFSGMVLVNWGWISNIINKAPELIQQAKLCGDNVTCIKTIFLPLISGNWVIFFISSVVVIVLYAWLWLGLMAFFLHLNDNGWASIHDLFLPLGKSIKMLLASWLYLLIIFGGLVLLIIPGIYWGIRFSLVQYFILDKNAGIIDALKMSWRTTHGKGWQLFGLFLVIQIITTFANNIFIPLMIFTMPLQFMVYAGVYRRLTYQEANMPNVSMLG